MDEGKARICFLLEGDEIGGAPRSILQLLQGIDRDRYEVFLFCCREGRYTRRLRAHGYEPDVFDLGGTPQMRRSMDDGVTRDWSGCAQMPGWIMRTTRALSRYVRARGIQIIHTNYLHFHLVAALAARRCDARCVWHWRGPMGKPFTGAMGRFLGKRIGRYGWSIANSRATYQHIADFSGDRRTVVYNGITVGTPDCARTELRQLLGVPLDRRLIGLVGTIRQPKGHPQFIEAAKAICERHHDVDFVAIGAPPTDAQISYYRHVLRRREELGLVDRVHFPGHRDDARKLVSGFDISTMLTQPPGEGFGLVLIEAMAQRIPVISTSEGAAPEIIKDNETGLLLPAGNIPALVDAIERLLGDDALRQRLAEAGYADCRERFDIRRTVQQVQEVYDQVLAERDGKA